MIISRVHGMLHTVKLIFGFDLEGKKIIKKTVYNLWNNYTPKIKNAQEIQTYISNLIITNIKGN